MSHINTHTHTHHAALLPTPNNASHRRDGAAAVATRERCGRAETAGRGLRGDWLGTDSALMSSLPPLLSPVCPSIHPLTHPSPACRHPSIQWTGEREGEGERETEREDILYRSFAQNIYRTPYLHILALSNPSLCLVLFPPHCPLSYNVVNFYCLFTRTVRITVIQYFMECGGLSQRATFHLNSLDKRYIAIPKNI